VRLAKLRAKELLIVLLMLGIGGWANAQPPDRDALFMEVSQKTGARVRDEPGIVRVEVDSERAIYFFTQPDHFAHPSVVIRKVEQRDGTIGFRTQGFTSGDKAVFNRWISAFLEQDEQRRRESEKKSRAQ
jgi:hypothetical protein